MNNRINSLFEKKPSGILSVFVTAGFPQKDSTVDILCELNSRGVDMVEIGMPFSDPMADGPVIQESSNVAIKNGINISVILNQVAEARRTTADMPFILMGYINPVMQYGFRRFFEDASKAGVDGLIIPDLPFEDYINYIRPLSLEFSLPVIMLITPETSDERIHLIDDNCDGFIYMVSSASTTGTRDSFNAQQIDYFKRVAAMPLHHPRLIGFGISNPATYNEASKYASGVIIGSLFIKCLRSEPTAALAVEKLLTTIGRA